MKTRIICLLLVLLMCLPLVVACGNDNGGEGTENGGENNNGSGNNNGGNRPGGGDTVDAWWDDIDYDPTTLRFKLTQNTNNEELPSGCERYMEGKGGANTTIDQMVADRNEDALYYTQIEEVIYTYYTDDDKYNFAKTFDVMYDEIMNPDLDSPDMYCNWMSDMLVASLRGCFANVYSHERGANYIKLDDPGYMAELMGSLTLNQEKIYVIASDYFIDLIRAFFCIPVSVDLYNSVVSEDLCEDYDGNGLDINDFFTQVLNKEWTYAKMMDYCAAVYRDTNSDVADEDLKDTLGFALGKNGLPAAGLVYTSSVTVIHKDRQDDGTFNYYYAEENQDLYNLAIAIQGLVEAKGVMCVTRDDAGTVGVTDEGAELLSIRKQFTGGNMLFGGIILVGSLEYTAYQEMNEDESGGFGVVPVPVYKPGDSYLTQIHVVGRAGAISFYTSKFSQCTAFLHYQSSNSTDILNYYYDQNLTYDVADDLDGNVEMLKYLRSNVRTSFDKLFEDAIGFLYESNGDDLMTSSNRWHTIICEAFYKKADIRTNYETLVGAKNSALDKLVTQYVSLND